MTTFLLGRRLQVDIQLFRGVSSLLGLFLYGLSSRLSSLLCRLLFGTFLLLLFGLFLLGYLIRFTLVLGKLFRGLFVYLGLLPTCLKVPNCLNL